MKDPLVFLLMGVNGVEVEADEPRSLRHLLRKKITMKSEGQTTLPPRPHLKPLPPRWYEPSNAIIATATRGLQKMNKLPELPPPRPSK